VQTFTIVQVAVALELSRACPGMNAALLAAAEGALAGVQDGRNPAPEGRIVRPFPERFPAEVAWDPALLGAFPSGSAAVAPAGLTGARGGVQRLAPGPAPWRSSRRRPRQASSRCAAPCSLRAAGPRRNSDAPAQALEASAKAVVNLAREGVGPATAATWDFLVGTLRRLLGYAAARGYGHQPALELLFNGPLMMEYVAFMVVGRRGRRRHIGRGGGRAPDARSAAQGERVRERRRGGARLGADGGACSPTPAGGAARRRSGVAGAFPPRGGALLRSGRDDGRWRGAR